MEFFTLLILSIVLSAICALFLLLSQSIETEKHLLIGTDLTNVTMIRVLVASFLTAFAIVFFLIVIVIIMINLFLNSQSLSKTIFVNEIVKSRISSVIRDGLNITRSSGASWTDYNEDGYLDLLIPKGKIALYKNIGYGDFVDVTNEANLSSFEATSGFFADYDNDGCKDLFLNHHSTLLRSNCDGTFKDVSQKSRIKKVASATGAAWADYDQDGYLDLYTVTYGDFELKNKFVSAGDHPVYIYEPNALYRNNGDGTFRDVTKAANVLGVAICDIPDPTIGYYKLVDGPFKESYQPIWFDYNNDNKIDLFVATDAGISPLYKNNGNGTFRDVTNEAGLCRRGSGMGVTVGDFDNDGNLDIYVTNNGPNYLWHNKGNGTFEEIGAESGVADHKELGWGTEFVDFNNDGYIDLYVANGKAMDIRGHSAGGEELDRLYVNEGNKIFTNVAQKEGIYGNYNKEPVVVGDYNNDGFQDIFVTSGRYEKKHRYNLYTNQGNSNNWLTLKLVGTKSNRDAVGARITIKANGQTQTKEVISGSSFLSQSSLWQTFGLGLNPEVDSIEISWPSGILQSLYKIKANQTITIEEE